MWVLQFQGVLLLEETKAIKQQIHAFLNILQTKMI